MNLLRRVALRLSPVLLLAPLPALAQQPVAQAPEPGYTPIPGYVLRQGETLHPSARFHHSPSSNTVLIRDTEGGRAFVVDPRRGRVTVFEAEAFQPLPSGNLDLASGAVPEGEVAMRMVERRPAFTHDGVSYRVDSKPPLLGPQTAAEIIADDAFYGRAAAEYEPVPAYLDKLKAYDTETRVLVFFGSWCKNCHLWLPNILAVQEDLAGSSFSFEYHGVPQGYADPVAKANGVDSVPYGILFQDGEEVGRIVGPGWRFPDLQLVRSLGL